MNEELLIRYLNRKCSDEEVEYVRKWLMKSSANRRTLFELEQIWGVKMQIRFADEERIDKAYRRLSRELGFEKSEKARKATGLLLKFRVREWIKYAAILILASLLTVNLLHDGKERSLGYNTVIVPKGQRVSLKLSDGTMVWLNAGSQFSYPSRFSQKYRKVSLEGEGYFEVTHSGKSPFTVELQKLNVRVLGTKFNVKAYKGEPYWVALKEGSIEVATLDKKEKKRLMPNDQVYYTEQSGLLMVKSTHAVSANAWITGDLKFENKTLQEIIHSMERRYDVRIKIIDSTELVQDLFTCHFRKDISLRQAMDLLKETRRVNYRIEKDTVYLYRSK